MSLQKTWMNIENVRFFMDKNINVLFYFLNMFF